MTQARDRRKFLKCMAWAGTGVVWTMAGGVPKALALDDAASVTSAAGGKDTAAARAFSFVQISDSHIGFNKEANPDVEATLRQAITKINGMTQPPTFVVHTGDVTHLSKPGEFDVAGEALRTIHVGDLHVLPGEHDVIGDDGAAFFARFPHGRERAPWYSFDQAGVHFIALVNVIGLGAGGLGQLGGPQLEWLEDDLRGRTASTPIVVFAHMPLWSIYPQWGWGTQDSDAALAYLKRFGSVTVLNGHIHQIVQKVEGNIAFYTARATAFPQPVAGTAPAPGPLKVPADQLAASLGIRSISVARAPGPLAVTDASLADDA
ncbi:MAG: metallophosphoesterase [Rhodospirillales bacterium]|nr:metallophosphoesterase [Rhodospirillales bacterium]